MVRKTKLILTHMACNGLTNVTGWCNRTIFNGTSKAIPLQLMSHIVFSQRRKEKDSLYQCYDIGRLDTKQTLHSKQFRILLRICISDSKMFREVG
jgi:hypothetical protein